MSLTLDAVRWKSFPVEVQPMFDYFEAHRDEVDVVFLGSSFAKRHIDPRVFDEELARMGHSIQSLNLAVLGMGVFGSDLLVERILSLRPRRLAWVVIDIGHFGVGFIPGEKYTNKALWWHTPGQTGAVIRAVFARDKPIRENLSLAGAHIAHFLRQFAHLGMGSDYAKEALHELGDRPAPPSAPLLRDGGFLPHRGPQSSAFVEMREYYESAVAQAVKAGHWPRGSSVPGFHLPFLRGQTQRLRANGVEPIYILSPVMQAAPDVQAQTSTIELWRYNDPAEYPELFAFEARRDGGHLLEPWAREYTRLLARDFARVYADRHP